MRKGGRRVLRSQGPSGADRRIVGGFSHWLSCVLGVDRPEQEDSIKRVIGLPGETVELRGGHLFLDDVPVPEPSLRGPPGTQPYEPVEVTVDAPLILGGDRTNSDDSLVGLDFAPGDMLVDRAFAIVWPPSRFGWIL